MKLSLKIISVLLLSTIFIAGCKKTTGPKGDTGPAGPSGSSTMQVTTFTTATGDWTSYSWPYNYQEAVLSVPGITSSVVTSGDVRVYMMDASTSSWIGMPYSFVTNQYSYKYKSGQVILNLTLSNAAAPANPGVQQFKVVVVPSAFIKNNPDVNWNDYYSVQNYLNP